MARAMANSDPNTMKRLDRVETAIGQIPKILVEQSERVDSGFRHVVTTQERTLGFERLAEIERRLARLEQHTGL
jgi:hypothetical protein